MSGFLDLFNVIDSDGVNATRYRLHYIGSSLSNQDSWIFGMLTELVYVLFQLMVIPANALLGAVLNSSSWMGTLGEFYQKLTAPVFAVFPPWGIACFGLALVAVSALRSTVAPKGPQRGASMGMSSNALDRIGGSLAMAALVLVLTYNPFAMISKVLELANGFSLGLANAVTNSGKDTTIATGQALVDTSIRTPTIALNYGGEMTAACRTQWSQAMADSSKALAESSGCFGAGTNEASPGTLTTAVLMLILPALPMLVFCVIAAWNYLKHLSLAVFHLVTIGWIAALSVHKQRGFDRLAESFAKSVSHLVMAVVTSMLAVALPATVAGVGTQLLGLVSGPQAQAFVMMVSLGIGFGVSAWVINAVVKKHGVLATVLFRDADTNLQSLMSSDEETKRQFTNWKNLMVKGEFKETQFPSEQRKADRKAKRAALATDPVASTASARAGRPGRDTDSDPDDDVVQLMSAAQSVADAGGQSPADAGGPGPMGYPVNGSGTAGGPVVGGALFGSPTTEVTVLNVVAVTTVVNVVVDPYGYWGAPAPFIVDSDDSDFDDPAAPLALPRPPTGPGGSPAGGSALAELPRSTVPYVGGAPPQVPGLLGSNPALEAVSIDTGAMFVAGEKPTPPLRDSPLLRMFTPNVITPETPGGVPHPAYAPPLSAVPDPPAAATEAMLPAGVGQAPEVNDQQRWNQQRGARDTTPREDEAPTAAIDTGVEPATGPDVRKDPTSFQAPQIDFLDADDLERQILDVQEIAGASGNPVDVRIDPNDSRVGIDFSSDPEERVRPRGGSGFGDPV